MTVSVAIVGAGIGGLAAAAALRRVGADVRVYEQATSFTRVGSGIQMSPNAVKVLRAIGAETKLRRHAFEPRSFVNRAHDTGEVTNEQPLGAAAEARYGAPHLHMHRADLHETIASAVPAEFVLRDKKLVGFEQSASKVTLAFADGARAEADALIGADGVHSVVREILFGQESPRFTGRVAYRTTFPAALLGMKLDSGFTKWWGPDRHIVVYYTTARMDEIYFVTSQPEPAEWRTRESWSTIGDIGELRRAYAGFHPTVRAILDACPQVHRWVLFERDPLPSWGVGRAVLLGDACHPMTPYMAQGAAASLEDAAILARCLQAVDADGIESAFKRYEMSRKPRTSRIQESSHTNTWMRGKTDPDWVYSYDAWTEPLAQSAFS